MKIFDVMKKTLKRTPRTAIAVGLAAVLSAMPSMTTLAANQNNVEYISELKVASDKKFLTDNGYKLVNQDLNKGSKGQSAYIGYKTTKDRDDAITDISVMDMKGGYSYEEYEEMLEKKKKQIAEVVKYLRSAIAAYKENFEAGSETAKYVHEVMNTYVEDDSGEKVGDFLLGEDLTDAQLVTMIMESNAMNLSVIYNYLAMAQTEEEGDTWIDRLSKMGPGERKQSKNFNNFGEKLLDEFEIFQSILRVYVDAGVDYDDEEALKEYLEPLTSEERSDWMVAAGAYKRLKEYKYGDGTLVDFFMKSQKDMDYEELHPLADAMTEGQLSLVGIVGIKGLLGIEDNTAETVAEVKKKTEEAFDQIEKDEKIEIPDTMSLYAGIDRSMFHANGVALTDAALRKSASSRDYGYMNAQRERDEKTTELIKWLAIGFSIGAGVAAVTVGVTLIVAAAVTYGGQSVLSFLFGELVYHMAWEVFWKMGVTIEQVLAPWVKGLSIVGGIGVELTIICAGLWITYYCLSKNNEKPTYDSIPRMIVETKTVKIKGRQTEHWVAYNAVNEIGADGKNKVEEKEFMIGGEKQKVTGEVFGDLNGYNGNEWIVVYTSKDEYAGEPVLADTFKTKVGTNKLDAGYSALHMFGEDAAYNTNKYSIPKSGTRTTDIFMYYKRTQEASVTGTVLSDARVALVGGLSALVGIIIGCLGMSIASRSTRKRRRARA